MKSTLQKEVKKEIIVVVPGKAKNRAKWVIDPYSILEDRKLHTYID